MPLSEFDGKTTFAARAKLPAATLNAIEQGVQDEIEERAEMITLNGVVSGCALSISTTNVLIGAGSAIVEGKRYTPAASAIPFTAADGVGTYHLYVDPTNDTTPYQKAIADPGAGFLVLGLVTWDGASVLSGLVDYGRMGLVYHELQFHVAGALTAGDDAICIYGGSDGRSFKIEGVKGLLENAGYAGGPTLFAAYAGAGAAELAIWATGSRRVSIAANTAYRTVYSGGEPEQNQTVSPGQVVRLTVDVAATGAADARGVVYGRLV